MKILGLEKNNDNIILRRFSGSPSLSSGTTFITIHIGEVTVKTNAVIVNSNTMRHECIVGCDILNLPNVVFYKIRESFVIK